MPGERKAKQRAQHAPAGGKTKAGRNGSPALWLLGGAVLLLGLLGAIWVETSPRHGAAAQASSTSAIGGPFRMIDQDGKPVTEAVLKGKWTAVFFGYTYCPDVCPATLQALGGAYKKLGDNNGRDFQVVFATVDPARDHPTQLKAYIDAQSLPMHTLGLTGSPDQVAVMAKAYKASYAKAGEGPDYSMDHTAIIYLMDPAGRFAAPLTHDMAPDKIATEILAAERRG